MARLPASVSPLLGRHTGTMCGCRGCPAPCPAPFPAPRSSRTSARSLSLVRLSNPGCKTTSRIAASWCGSGSPALSMLSSPSRTCSRLVSAPCKLEPVHTQGGEGGVTRTQWAAVTTQAAATSTAPHLCSQLPWFTNLPSLYRISEACHGHSAKLAAAPPTMRPRLRPGRVPQVSRAAPRPHWPR